ncbi:MAG TPA: hypothetical protein V6D33_15235, partial [Cyanophyceae cyanobacterium]
MTAKRLTDFLGSKLGEAKKLAAKGWDFFRQWFKDDPVNATVGAAAAVLTLGVLVVVGGEVIGAIGGGISILSSMSFLSAVKTAVGVGAAAGILGGLIRWAVRGVQYTWNFNWNITDKQIRQQQEGLISSLYGQAGATIGTALGTLLCGSAPVEIVKRTNLVKVNPMILAQIKEVSEFNPESDEYGELYEELMENVKALVSAGTRVAGQVAFIESYKNLRKWIKNGAKFVGLKKIFPKLDSVIQKWGEEGSQSWSFASAVENFVESIDDQNLQTLTEETIESFMDSCTESVMIISYIF